MLLQFVDKQIVHGDLLKSKVLLFNLRGLMIPMTCHAQ